MDPKKYKMFLSHSAKFVDYSKPEQSEGRNVTREAGTYTVTAVPNPHNTIRVKYSNWLVFEGTTIGATSEYVRSVARVLPLDD